MDGLLKKSLTEASKELAEENKNIKKENQFLWAFVKEILPTIESSKEYTKLMEENFAVFKSHNMIKSILKAEDDLNKGLKNDKL